MQQSYQIALLCPTRMRPVQAIAMAQSAYKTAHDPSTIHVYYRVDDNDPTVPRLRRAAELLHHATVLIGPRGRGYVDISLFCNELAAHAVYHDNPNIFGLLNDDCTFVYDGWDRALVDAFAAAPESKDGVGLALGPIDPDTGEGFRFVFMTRAWYDRLGYFCHPKETHADTFLEYVARDAGRVVDVPLLFVHHRIHDKVLQEAEESSWEHRTSDNFWSPEHTQWREDAATVLRGKDRDRNE